MGRRDARRLGVIQAALQGKLTNREGAGALGLSLRQFKRLKAAVHHDGVSGVVHGNRGRVSARRLNPAVVERVQGLLTHAEVKLNDCHVVDLLAEHGVAVSVASVRRLRVALRLPAKRRRRPPQHHRRRTRAARRGALVQIDGSPFAWWSDAAPPCSLVGAIDDASGSILALTLQPSEDVHAYATMLDLLFRAHGLPACLYGDHTSILVRNDPHWTLAEELAGQQNATQIGQALAELGVEYRAAHSPQAKGRVERLWNTLQDRLAAEMRLHRIHSQAAAQAYLPGFIARYNARFAIPAADCVSVFRAAPRDLAHCLCCRYQRVVARDDTVTLPGRWAQLPAGPYHRTWHKARVEVRELLDGRLRVIHPRAGVLVEQPAPPGPFRLVSRTAARREGTPRMPPKPRLTPPPQPLHGVKDRIPAATRPAPDHPMRGSYKNIQRRRPSRRQGVSESLNR